MLIRHSYYVGPSAGKDLPDDSFYLDVNRVAAFAAVIERFRHIFKFQHPIFSRARVCPGHCDRGDTYLVCRDEWPLIELQGIYKRLDLFEDDFGQLAFEIVVQGLTGLRRGLTIF